MRILLDFVENGVVYTVEKAAEAKNPPETYTSVFTDKKALLDAISFHFDRISAKKDLTTP